MSANGTPPPAEAATASLSISVHPEGVVMQIFLDGKAGSWIRFDTARQAWDVVESLSAHVRLHFGPPPE